MKRSMMITLLALSAVTLSQPTYAHRSGEGIRSMADEQQQQIRRGVKRGDLTRYEVKRLKADQHRLRELRKEFRDDGRLSKKERKILRKGYRKAGRKIDRFLHNDERRGHRHGWRHNSWAYRDDHGSGTWFGFWYRDDDLGIGLRGK